jgi:hypothetical protein
MFSAVVCICPKIRNKSEDCFINTQNEDIRNSQTVTVNKQRRYQNM